MNNKLLVSAISITSALALMGGVTFALFSSTASNAGNTFGAGTMTLNINSFGGSTSSKIFNISNAKPTDVFGPQILNLSNTGTVGAATSTLTSITVSPSGSPNLGDKLNLELWRDLNDDGLINGVDTQIGVSKPLTDAQWTGLNLGIPLAVGANMKVLARITFDSSADYTYQGTSVTFDFNFRADQ